MLMGYAIRMNMNVAMPAIQMMENVAACLVAVFITLVLRRYLLLLLQHNILLELLIE